MIRQSIARKYSIWHAGSPKIHAFSDFEKDSGYRFRFSEDFCVGVRNGYSPGQQPNVS
jgi:hypothetical protein